MRKVARAVVGAGMVLAAMGPGARAAAPPPPLVLQAARVQREALAQYEKRDLKKAAELFGELVRLRERLYPEKDYPRGHRALATSLNNLGFLLWSQGEHARALPYYERALAMRQKLYPAAEYPRGHSDLANSFNSLGVMLWSQGEYAKALSYHERALAVYQRLYPEKEFPRGHTDLATSLSNLGAVLWSQGEYARALPYHERALAMRQKLYPEKEFPRGHTDLVHGLNSLGAMLLAQGEYAKALPYLERALAMFQRLHPEEKFPKGHPHLAVILNNLGFLLQSQGEHARALPYYERALAMRQKLYPAAEYPRGHSDLIQSLHNLGFLLQGRGDYAKAQPYYERALAMGQKLYPEGEYPRGDPVIARSLSNLGAVLWSQGEYARALPYHERALAMRQKLYPAAEYPRGHPDIAHSLSNLGAQRLVQGRGVDAVKHLARADTLFQQLLEDYAGGSSEAEALNFAATLPASHGVYLAAAREAKLSPAVTYAQVWRGKAALARLQQRRRLELTAADPEARAAAGELRDARLRLSRALMTPPTARGYRPGPVKELTEQKEALERKLAKLLPGLRRQRELDALGPDALAKALPARSALVDFHPEVRFAPAAKGTKRKPQVLHYTAFVLLPGKGVRRVDLGEAKPADDALAAWRQAITDPDQGPRTQAAAAKQAALLGKRLWAPLRDVLPADVQAVWVVPEGALAGLPWAALPGRKAGAILLEDHAVAVLPSAPFLLEQLKTPSPKAASPAVLALGGVDYDRAPVSAAEGLALRSPALPEGKKLSWPALKGTAAEAERVLALAKGAKLKTLPLVSGRGANADALLGQLPKARYAHLATHGFLADPRFRSALALDPEHFRSGASERASPGARSPLVLSGLVLAGANRPPDAAADRGILTAEAIAGLDLGGLELAVLSACDSGRGGEGGGEGVYGLQRAFHIAGARNVVATLWPVHDEATAALMGLFYHRLWVKKEAPAEALRQAQLHLYRHPELIPKLAKLRAPDWGSPEKLPKPDPKGEKRARPGLWAGVVLSGVGR